MPTHAQGLSLRQNFLWTILGNVIYGGCQWGILVVLAKLTTPEAVGQFAFGWALCTPIFMGSSLQLRVVQATDARREYGFGHYLALRLVTVVAAYLLIVGIAFFMGFGIKNRLILITVGLAKSIESLGDIIAGLFQQNEQMDWIAISMILKGPLSLLSLFLTVYLTGEIFWGVLAMAVAMGLVLIFYDLNRVRDILGISSRNQRSIYDGIESGIVPCWDRKVVNRLARQALPLGIVALLWSIDLNIPRYFIEGYWGARELGIFAALAAIMISLKLLVTALIQTVNPRLAKYYADGQPKHFLKLLGKLLALGIMMGIVSFLVVKIAGKELLTWLYSPEYAEYNDVLKWLTVCFGLVSVTTFFDNILIILRRFKTQMIVFCFELILTVIFCYWLVPLYGILGATLAIVYSATLQLLFLSLIMIKILKNYYLSP